MTLAVGQRWLYDWNGYVFILEVLSIRLNKSVVVQSNEFAKQRGYIVGEKTVDWNLEQNNFCNYLPGQDKP